MRQKNDTLFAWTQFKSNQPSNKASVVRSKDLITKKDEMSILATGKQSLGLFASDLYKMSSPTHSTAEAPFRRWDIYSRVCGGPTFNNLPIQAPLLTILRMIRLEFHSWSFVIVWNIDPFILENFFWMNIKLCFLSLLLHCVCQTLKYPLERRILDFVLSPLHMWAVVHWRHVQLFLDNSRWRSLCNASF